MEVLVNGTMREISPIFDSTGKNITETFLKEAATERAVRDFSSDLLKTRYKDFNIYVAERKLPLLFFGGKTENIKDGITYNNDTNQIEMSENSFKWWERYSQKYNEVSALENKIFPHFQKAIDKKIEEMQNVPISCDYTSDDKQTDIYLYRMSYYSNPISEYSYLNCSIIEAPGEELDDFILEKGDVNSIVNTKSNWLRMYAENHKIDISDINQVSRLNRTMLLNMEAKEKDEQIAVNIAEKPNNFEQQDVNLFIDKVYEYTTMVGMDYTKEFLKEQIGKDLSGEHFGRYNGFFIYEHLSSLCTSAILFKKDPQITMSAKNMLSEAESLISKYMDKDAVKTYKEIEALYINDMDDKHKETYASAKDVKIDYFYFTKEKAEQKIKDYESIFLTNIKLKYAVNKLREVINRTNAIFRENPSLSKAFEQAKAKFMQKHNSEKQEHFIDKPIQKNKPNKHSKK